MSKQAWYAEYDAAQEAFDRSPSDENAAKLRLAEIRMLSLRHEHDCDAAETDKLAALMLKGEKS